MFIDPTPLPPFKEVAFLNNVNELSGQLQTSICKECASDTAETAGIGGGRPPPLFSFILQEGPKMENTEIKCYKSHAIKYLFELKI